MAVSNFIQTIWSKKIQDDLELKCKLVDNCLRDYEGDCKYAASVKILGVGEPTITAYSSSTPISYEAMSDVGQTLTIDQQYSFSFLVDDINKAQSVPGLSEKYQEKAVHGLAVKRDAYVASLIKAETTNVTIASNLTREAVKTAIDAAIVALRERNFGEEGVIEITPAVYNVFKNELITLSTDNPEYIKKGIVGVYDDFKVVMSNGLAKDASGATKYAYCAVRGKKAIAFAGQINEVEAGRHQDYFADYIRGLDTFGAKTIDADRLQVVKVPLVEQLHAVTFTVTDDTSPTALAVEGATVSCGGTSALTNASGVAVLYLAADTYGYVVAMEGYVTQEDEVVVGTQAVAVAITDFAEVEA